MFSFSKAKNSFYVLKAPLTVCFRVEKYFSKSSKVYKNPLKRKGFSYNSDLNENSRVCVTILGNGAVGQPKSIGLFTDRKIVLFNCGEGVSRLLREYGADFHQIKYAFITQNIWSNLSGLPDIYITLYSYGHSFLNLFGPPGVENFKSLVTADAGATKICKRKTPYLNDTFQISSISTYADNINGSRKNRCGLSDVVFSYVCKILAMPSQLVPEKLVEHNVPLGPHLLKLKKGEDIELPCGRIIYAADVIDAVKKEEFILIVDCPSKNFLSPFVKNVEFHRYQLPSDTASKVSTIFHFSPPHITSTKMYQDWMHNFHSDVQHIILNNTCSPVCSEAVYQCQSVLHHLHSDIFKLLPNYEVDKVDSNSSTSVIYPPSMLQINYRPLKSYNWGNIVDYIPQQFVQDTSFYPEFNEELSKLKSIISSSSQFLENKNQCYPEVVFLGTSSSTSSAYRNVTAILLNVNSRKSILLDCGEGTLMQFVRYFGTKAVDFELRKLSCIFVSHLHTDHYLGLFLLLKARIEAFDKAGYPYQPVSLILPYRILNLFKHFCEVYDNIYNKVRIFSCKSMVGGLNHKSEELQRFLDDIEVETVPVKHCSDAYGIVVKKGTSWKIVYSGDSSPCQKLIDAGENCTLLIHEASIEDDCMNEALIKTHCTPSQVIDVSEKMNAQHTILTHFSKRYLAIPLFENSNKRIGCAFDFMKVNLNQLPLVPLFLPAMKCLFPDQIEKHNERTSYVVTFENSFLKSYKDFFTTLKNKKVSS